VKHEMSAPVLVLNLIADLCPHGMLMLAYGMGAEGGTGAFPSTMLVAVFGALAVYTMWSLGALCAASELASRLPGSRDLWWVVTCGVVHLARQAGRRRRRASTR